MFIVTKNIETSIGSVIHQTSCNAEQEHNAISLFVQKEGNVTLEEYADILQKEVLFEKNQYCDGYVIDREITLSKMDTQFSMSVLVCQTLSKDLAI